VVVLQIRGHLFLAFHRSKVVAEPAHSCRDPREQRQLCLRGQRGQEFAAVAGR
jgi:hypothetical protein